MKSVMHTAYANLTFGWGVVSACYGMCTVRSVRHGALVVG